MTATTELVAGRELDALVLEKVIKVGLVVHDTPWGFPVRYPPDIPHYSTDIAAAWEVVEKVKAMGLCWELDVSDLYVATVYEDVVKYRGYGDAPTMAEAICRAALKAVGA